MGADALLDNRQVPDLTEVIITTHAGQLIGKCSADNKVEVFVGIPPYAAPPIGAGARRDRHLSGANRDGPMPSDRVACRRDVELAGRMLSYWANFALTRNPNGKGQPSWSAFFTSASGQALGLDGKVEPTPWLHLEGIEFFNGH